MNSFLFFLGRNKELSLLELKAVLGEPEKVYKEGIVLYESKEDLSLKQNFLGGTIKIAKIIADNLEENTLDLIIIKILEEKEVENNKKIFALNYYGGKKEFQFLRNHLMRIKKSAPFSARFCNNGFKNVSSVVTMKKLLSKGKPEINVLQIGDNFMLSETVSSQDIDAYSKRDYNKPFRDAKIGMLPPKLAQIMINLAFFSSPGKGRLGGVDLNEQTIWDPFCGTGTVLIEGLIMGKNVIGSDFDEDMVEASDKNIEWFTSFYPIAGKTSEVFKHDATKFVEKKCDAVVTEGYLGVPKSKMTVDYELMETDEELSRLYDAFFANLKSIGIKTVVMCLPVYRMKNGLGFMEKTLTKILDNGYKIDPLSDSDIGSIIYSRDDQFVLREIFKFVI